MNKKEEFQKKAVEFQMLQGSLKAIQEREQDLAHRLNELNVTKRAFEDLNNINNKDNTMIPLGGGNFIEGTISDKDNVLVSIGGGIAVKRTSKEAAEITESRINEVEDVMVQLKDNSNKAVQRLIELEPELEKMSKELE